MEAKNTKTQGDKMNRKPRIYFCQYGFVFSMTLQSAIALCEVALTGSEFRLDQFGKMIKATANRHNVSTKFDHGFAPLDWDREDWAYCLETLKSIA